MALTKLITLVAPFSRGPGDSYSQFQKILSHLEQLQKALEDSEQELENPIRPLYLPLRYWNNLLLDMLPQDRRDHAEQQWEVELLKGEEVQNENFLNDMIGAFGDSPSSRRLRMLAGIKRVQRLIEDDDSRRELRLLIKRLTMEDNLELNYATGI